MPQASSSVAPMYVGGSWSYLSKYSVSAVYYGSNRANGYYLGANSGNNDSCHNDRNYYTNASWNCFLVSRDFGRMGEFDLDYMPHGYALYQILNGNVNNNTVIYDLDYNVDIENQTWPDVGQSVELIFSIGLYNFASSSLPDSNPYINPNQLSLGLMKTDYSGLINISGSSYNLHIYQAFNDIVLDEPDIYGCMNTNGSCSSAQNVKAIRYVTTYFTFNWTQELDSLVKSGSYTAFRVTKTDSSSSSLVAGYGDFLGDVFRPVLTLEGSNLKEYVIHYDDNSRSPLMVISFPPSITSSRIYFKDCVTRNGSVTDDIRFFNGTFFGGFLSTINSENYDTSPLDILTYNFGSTYTPRYRSYVDFNRSNMDFVYLYSPSNIPGKNNSLYFDDYVKDESVEEFIPVLTPIVWAWDWLKSGFSWIKKNLFGLGDSQVVSNSGGSSSSGGGVHDSVPYTTIYPMSCTLYIDDNAIVSDVYYDFDDFTNTTTASYSVYDNLGNVITSSLNESLSLNFSDPTSYIQSFSNVFTFNKNVITSFVSSDDSPSQNLWQQFIALFGFIVILFVILRRFKM